MAYTVAQLREKIRQRCDLENTTDQVDAEILGHINDAASKVHDLLVSQMQSGYGAASKSFSTVAGTAAYDLSAAPISLTNFGRAIRVSARFDDRDVPLPRMPVPGAVLSTSSGSWSAWALPRYQVYWPTGVSQPWLEFDPPPDSVRTVTVRYQTKAPTYTADANPVLFPCDAAVDYVVVEAALRMKDKGDRDAVRLERERLEIEDRIRGWVESFDDANPEAAYDAAGRTSLRRLGGFW